MTIFPFIIYRLISFLSSSRCFKYSSIFSLFISDLSSIIVLSFLSLKALILGFTSISIFFSSRILLLMLSVSLSKFPFICLVFSIPNTKLDNLCASSILLVLQNISQIFLYSAFLLFILPLDSAI